MAIVSRHGCKLIRLTHLSAHHVGRAGHFRDLPNNQLLQPGLAEKAAHLRVQRFHIEGHEEIGLAVLDLVLQHLLGIERRIVHDRTAGFHHTEKRDDVVGRIGEIEADVNAGLDPEVLQALGGAIGELIQLAVADPPPHEFKRRLVSPFFRRILQNLLERHGGQFGIPAHALRIGFDPRKLGHSSLPQGSFAG